MTSSYLNQGIRRIIHATIPPQASSLISDIERWCQSSGTEWTCARLKNLRTGIYQLRAGNAEIARSIWQRESIAYDKKTLLPKGIFGYIGKQYIRAQQHGTIRRFDAMLRIYTKLKLESLSDNQLSKAKRAINSPFTGNTDSVQSLYHIIRREGANCGFNYRKPGKPDLSKLRMKSATHKVGKFPTDLTKKPWGKHVCSLWTSTYIPEELRRVNPAEAWRQELVLSGSNETDCGHIAFIQEGGCKARVVAVPNAWIQVLLEPLEVILDDFIRALPESCNHDQCRGAYFLRDSLKAGKEVYCFDLSSATDRFPLSLQKGVLTSLGYEAYASAIESIAKGNWIAQYNGVEEIWHYTVGQPMGMYCSFKLFHLTHILMLRGLCRQYGIDVSQGMPFRVLGDDVIITDKLLAQQYSYWMQEIGVELSSAKSILSAQFGEFAGFVGIKTNKTAFVHRPFKFSGKGLGSPMNLIFAIGKSVRKISDWYADAYEIFRETIGDRNPDLSPINTVDRDPMVGETLNSHLMGSLSNQASYFLDFMPSDNLLSIYENQQIILLGEKETVVDGFASKSDNLFYATPQKLDKMIDSKKSDCFTEFQYSISLTKDPLFKRQRALVKEATID